MGEGSTTPVGSKKVSFGMLLVTETLKGASSVVENFSLMLTVSNGFFAAHNGSPNTAVPKAIMRPNTSRSEHYSLIDCAAIQAGGPS